MPMFCMTLDSCSSDELRGIPKNDSLAAKWYLKAAKLGHVSAQLSIGTMYADGEGVLKDDLKALGWMGNAADQGCAAAQYCLGMMYATGRGVQQDTAKAMEWYAKAAKQGIAEAQDASDLTMDESDQEDL